MQVFYFLMIYFFTSKEVVCTQKGHQAQLVTFSKMKIYKTFNVYKNAMLQIPRAMEINEIYTFDSPFLCLIVIVRN